MSGEGERRAHGVIGRLRAWVVDISVVGSFVVSGIALLVAVLVAYLTMVSLDLARIPTGEDLANVKTTALGWGAIVGGGLSLALAFFSGIVNGRRSGAQRVKVLESRTDQVLQKCRSLEERLARESYDPPIRQDFELVNAKYRFKFYETWPLSMDYEMELTLRALQDGLDSFTDQLQWSGNDGGKTMQIEARSQDHVMRDQFDADMWHHFTVELSHPLARNEQETLVLGATLVDSGCSFQPFSAKCFDRLVGKLVLRVEYPSRLWPSRVEPRVYPYFLAPKPIKKHCVAADRDYVSPAVGLPGEMLRVRPSDRYVEWVVPNPSVTRRYALHWEWDLDSVRAPDEASCENADARLDETA